MAGITHHTISVTSATQRTHFEIELPWTCHGLDGIHIESDRYMKGGGKNWPDIVLGEVVMRWPGPGTVFHSETVWGHAGWDHNYYPSWLWYETTDPLDDGRTSYNYWSWSPAEIDIPAGTRKISGFYKQTDPTEFTHTIHIYLRHR